MVWKTISWYSTGPINTLQNRIAGSEFNFDRLHSSYGAMFVPWWWCYYQRWLNPFFTQFTSLKTGFETIMMICCCYPDNRSHQISILLSLCCLVFRETCIVTIFLRYWYLNLSLFFRKIDIRFPWNCIYPFIENCR